ncbi:hypothetical protein DPMN_125192 [Dreissena polymorpha]|uniref:Uncharacterized protein n=1 Tax=Dreissena polymorpha TaxID=45954 RepID=A0A9D4GX21_DREPO|nr:hypothetical protein DPMN_125192 [Dreissena polymorpha]
MKTCQFNRAGKRRDFQMCAGSSSLAAEVNSHDFGSDKVKDTFGSEGLKADMNRKKDAVGSDGFGSWHEQKSKHMIRVTGLHMEEDFHLCDTSLQKQEGQMSSSTDVFLGGSSQTVSTSLSCSEGKEEDFNKESLLQLSSLNKLVTEKKFSSCVLTVATSCLMLGRCQQCEDNIALLLDECSLLLDVSGLLPGEQ